MGFMRQTGREVARGEVRREDDLTGAMDVTDAVAEVECRYR